MPWSSGVAGSSSSSTATSTSTSQQRQGAPDPRVLRPDMYAQSFRSPVKSLQFNRGEVIYLPQLEGNMLGRGLLTLLGAYSRKQTLRNGASVLYQGITEAAENTQLQEALGLEVGSFMAPFNLLSLHMWLIINRLHQEPDSKDNKFFSHTLYHDYFYKDMERRVFAHGVQIRVGKWVDRLQKQFYGTSFAYDKAIRVEGGGQAQQAALVGALVKNMYNADASNQPWAELTARYLFRELACLDKTDAAAIYKGHVRFSDDIVKS